MKHVSIIQLLALVVATGFGCSKPARESVAPLESLRSEDSVVRIHWLGKNRIAADANAAGVMQIWGLYETKMVQAQALDKLSLAPWQFFGRDPTNSAAPLLRPLLDDLVQEELYLEVRHATNQPAELVFAIRLSNDRAGLWETNLAAVFESLTAIRPNTKASPQRGWSLQKHHAPDFIQLTRAGEWTVLAMGKESNALLETVLGRIQHYQTPFVPGTNFWLDADIDWQGLTNAFALGWNLPENPPKISMRVAGNALKVESRIRFNFPKPLAIDFEPWNIPTNLISATPASFTAIRGIRPWLTSAPLWRELQMEPPNQICIWASPGNPIGTFLTIPSADASNQIARITDLVLQNKDRWFESNSMVRFERSQRYNGLEWKGPPIAVPHVRSIESSAGNYILAGFAPVGLTNRPGSVKIAHDLSLRTNMIAFDWEVTGTRIEQLLYLSQFTRLATHRPQLPTNSASVRWLKAVTVRLSACGSEISQTGPNQLTFVRKSDLGFSATELHLMADWVESPKFPRGLYSLQPLLQQTRPLLTNTPAPPPAGIQ